MKKYCFLLFLSLLSLGGFYSCSSQSTGQNAPENSLLDTKTFNDKVHTLANAQLLDVRTPEEYSSGYIKGAVNMNYNADDFSENVSTLDKEKPVLVYCKGGGRSAGAAAQLKKAGFKNVYDLDGGIMAWENAGLPVEKATALAPDANLFTEKDFDLLRTGKDMLLIDFYATWCEPCKRMEPVLNQLAETYKGQVDIVRINVDQAVDLCKKMQIEGLPVVCTYKKGEEISRVKGEQNKAELDAMIQKILF